MNVHHFIQHKPFLLSLIGFKSKASHFYYFYTSFGPLYTTHWHSWSLFCSPGCKTEESAAGGTSAMAFPFIIIVRTSDSTLVLSVRGPFGPLPRCSRSTASDHRSQEGKGPFCGRHWRGRGGGEADPLGRGFPLIQVCAEGERGG